MEQNYNQLNWLFSRKYWWLRHSLFWLFYYIDYVLAFLGITDEYVFDELFLYSLLLPDCIIVYLNLYVLIPRFFVKNKWIEYIGYTLLSLIAHAVITLYIDAKLDEYPFAITADEQAAYMSPFTYFLNAYLLPTIKLLGLAIALKVTLYYISNQQKLQELKLANVKTELAYLKNQVNPHFLFNALNIIHIQAEKYPKKVGESIEILSDLLRYQLYDGAKESVPLKKEIQYLRDYLDFDSHRKNKSQVDFQVNGNSLGINVAPFLFIPFIENAVKHGLNERGETYIRVLFEIEENQLLFEVENSKPKRRPTHLVGGIGLVNVRRRLDLLYPNIYTLDIVDERDSYTVKLMLKIHRKPQIK